MQEPHKNLRDVSFWFSELIDRKDLAWPTMVQQTEDIHADVCIVGAGYSGLWTAYELLSASPELNVVIIDAKYPGYGASGRNGGAVIPRINGSREFWGSIKGKAGTMALEKALVEAVDHVGHVIAQENIDCGYTKNGMLELARTPLELQRLVEALQEDRRYGHGPAEIRMLSKSETASRISAEGVIGAKLTVNAACIQPAALVLGLTKAVIQKGARIYYNTPVTSIESFLATTTRGKVHADIIVCAAEAYTQSIATERNKITPVHTSMLVTEKLSEEVFAQIGWGDREVVLAEHPFLHLQRTRDGRITIGGDDNRLTYKYGSVPCTDGPAEDKVFATYREELVRLFPALANVKIEHSWQGVFGARRDWAPAVGLNKKTGIAWIGGYVGEGLAASNLASRTLTDLILGRETQLTRLPLVRELPRKWEPEPLRMLGSVAILKMRHHGMKMERKTGRHSPMVDFANKLAGFTGFTG